MTKLMGLSILVISAAFLLTIPFTDSFAKGGDNKRGDNEVRFELTDEPGPWFKNENPIPGTTQSLAIAEPGARVEFKIGGDTETIHTITSLIFPVDAANMPFDQSEGHRSGGFDVELEDPGLYVFTCKIHPYMFGAVIVDDSTTDGLDLGEQLTLVNGIQFPSFSPLAVSLLKSFFIVTDPNNWQDYDEGTWNITVPPVDIRVTGGVVAPLDVVISDPDLALVAIPPTTPGIGEVWINTQFEHSTNKDNFGSASAVDTTTWKVTKKIALPEIDMNHPHNMWTDLNQDVIYQTMWFDDRLAMFDRYTGEFIDQVSIGESPSHVMTRPDSNQNIYVAMNGESSNDSVIELEGSSTELKITRELNIDEPNPHGHWMNADVMVTPNPFTGTSTIHEFDTGANTVIESSDLSLVDKIFGGESPFDVPIATGMHPNGEKYYVANLLDQTVTCVSIGDAACVNGEDIVSIKPILLIANLLPSLLEEGKLAPTVSGPAGVLPIQTPVSPDGRFVVTATLLPSITIIDTETDELVASLPCDAGCHGVNFGAKVVTEEDPYPYYAYVSSKFSNALIVVNPDPNNDGNASDATIAGKVILSTSNLSSSAITDDIVTTLDGMGGQGVLAIPNPYDGWIELTASSDDLSDEVQGWIDEMTTNGQNDPFTP